MGVAHRKTLKQKIVADYRHQTYSLENKTNFIADSSSSNSKQPDKSEPYTYVLNNTTKTGILTLLIIAGELVLFFLFKNHIISLPSINY